MKANDKSNFNVSNSGAKMMASCIRRSSIRTALAIALGAGAAVSSSAALVTNQQKNVVSALYSFDSILAFTGLAFGVDPTLPAFAMSGTLDDVGFAWSVATQYKGEPFAFSAAGSYDNSGGLTNWSGSGSLGVSTLSSSGVTTWINDSSFSIMDTTSLNGTPALWSIDAFGQPAANYGTMDINDELNPLGLVINDNYTVIRELETRHFFSFLFGPVTDGWLVKVSSNGVVNTNVYGLVKEGTKVGVSVRLIGGVVPAVDSIIDFGGQKIQKVGFITPEVPQIPEPANWTVMLAGLGLFCVTARRRA